MELIVIGLLVVLIISLVIYLKKIDSKLQTTQERNKHLSNMMDAKNDQLKYFEGELYQYKKENYSLREDNNNLSEARNLLELQANLTADEKNKLEAKLNLLQEKFTNLQISTSVSAVKNDSVEDLEAQLANLRRIIDDKVVELNNLNSSAAEITEVVNQKVRGLEELEAGMKALEGRILSGKEVLENINMEIKTTEVALADLANLKASVLAVEEGVGSV